MTSQEASAASHNSSPSREGLSQEGNNSQAGNNLVSTQAGRWAGRQSVRCSTRLRTSQTDSSTPQLESNVSLANQALPQVVRCSNRLRASQASQENSATPQASRARSEEGNTSPPLTVGLTSPWVLPWKNLTLQWSLTCPANLRLRHKGLF